MSIENNMVCGPDDFDEIDVSDIRECEECNMYRGNIWKIEQLELDLCDCNIEVKVK